MKLMLKENLTLLLWVSLMASSFVVSEQLLPYLNPIASTGLRFILATILMFPFIGKVSFEQLNYSILLRYSFISLFLVLFFIGLFEALKTTTVLRTSVIYTLLPLLSVGITYIGLKIITPKRQIAGFLIGTLGAIWVLMVFTQEKFVFFEWRLGDSIFLVACCCLALHVALIKKWAIDVPPILGAFYIMLLGSLILLPFIILWGDLSNIAWQQSLLWQTLLYLTIFTTIITFYLQQYLLKSVGPNRLLGFTYLIPSFVVISQGIASFSQLYSALPGIVLTLIALYLISPTHQ